MNDETSSACLDHESINEVSTDPKVIVCIFIFVKTFLFQLSFGFN